MKDQLRQDIQSNLDHVYGNHCSSSQIGCIKQWRIRTVNKDILFKNQEMQTTNQYVRHAHFKGYCVVYTA